MSFLLKTVLGIATIEAILLLLLVFGSNRALAASLDTELEKRAATTLALLDATARDAILSSDLATLESFAKQTVAIPDVSYMRVRSADGMILAQAHAPGYEALGVDSRSIASSGRAAIRPASIAVEVEGIPYATIEIGLSTANAVAATNSLRRQNLLIALSEMLLVALFSFLLGRYLTGELKKLANATSALAAGNLGLQVPVRGSDELAETLHSFNAMSQELLASHLRQTASEARLSAVLNGMRDGVVLLGDDLHVRYHNPRGHILLEIVCPQWNGDGPVSHLGPNPLDPALAQDQFKETVEVEIQGALRQFEVDTSRILGASELRSDWLLVLRDVTEDRSREAYTRRREQLAVVGRMSAGIAHDFNNILQIIIGLSEVNLVRSHGIDDELREDLETILEQAKRSSALVRQILEFSRSEEADSPTINIRETLASTTAMLGRTIPSTVELEFEPIEGELLAMFDASKLQQVLANLVINAVDAMPGGGAIALSAYQVEGDSVRPGAPDGVEECWVCVDVADDGAGILRKNLAKIFEPFFSTKERTQGTGLGLAQVYGLMQQQGGDIAVNSEVGVGTTFTLYLRPAQSTELQISAEPRRPERLPSGEGDSAMILLVEDEDVLRRALQAMLEELGHKVVTANNGLEGLRAYERYGSDIHVIVTDAVMPELGGIDFVSRLRASGCKIPIVLMSGYFEYSGVDLRALGEDLDGFLDKPVSIGQLAETLGKILVRGPSPDDAGDAE